MKFDLSSIKRGVEPEPARIMVYGTPGTGKTTFATTFPKPIFIRSESGLVDNEFTKDVATFPEIVSDYNDLIEAIGSLIDQDHNFETVVLDSIDWFDVALWKFINSKYSSISRIFAASFTRRSISSSGVFLILKPNAKFSYTLICGYNA